MNEQRGGGGDLLLGKVPACGYDPATRFLSICEKAEMVEPYLRLFKLHGQSCLAWLNKSYQQRAPKEFPRKEWSPVEKAFLGRLAHEQDHHFRHHYSTFGLLSYWTQALRARAFLRVVEEGCPEDSMARWKREWKCIDRQWNGVLHGGGNARRRFGKKGGAFAVPDGLNLGLDPGCRMELPVTGDYVLGATALFEALALSREITLVRISYGRNEQWIGQLDSSMPLMEGYNRARIVWDSMLSESLVPFSDSHPVWMHVSPQRVQPMEFYLAADLALWVPFFPDVDGNSRSDYATGWQDIHPGWRFLRIVDFFRSSGKQWAPPDSYPGVFSEQHVQIQNEICERFNWPTPMDLASAWLLFLRKTLDSGEVVGSFPERFDRNRCIASCELLATHLRSPADVCYGILAPENRGRHWFSGVECDDGYLFYDEMNGSKMPHPFATEKIIGQVAADFPAAALSKEMHELFVSNAAAHLSRIAANGRVASDEWEVLLGKALGI